MTDPKQSESSTEKYTVKRIKQGEKTVTGRVVGRNKTVIPEEDFLNLARLHCTWQEISDFFGVPVQTLRDNFWDLWQQGQSETRQRLRRAQLDLALKGDRVMLIWLGKQILGQSETPVNTDENRVLPWNEQTES